MPRTSPDRLPALGLRTLAIGCAAALVLVVVVTLAVPHAGVREVLPSWMRWVMPLSLGVWLAGGSWERRRGLASPRVTAILVGLAVGTTWLGTQREFEVLTGDRVRGWNLFHYHLGSKYFPELGYEGLYAGCLATDDDWQAHKATLPATQHAQADAVPDFREVRHARDQRTYDIRRRRSIVERFDGSLLSKERRATLGEDCRRARRLQSAAITQEIFTDRGFNPAPGWVVLGRPLASLLPLEGTPLWLLANSDVPLLAAVIVATAWAWGPRVAAMGWLFLMGANFNHGRLTGGMLQYDWLASMVLAVALVRRGWHGSGGVALAWAVMTRVFPAIMAVPALAWTAWTAWGAARSRPVTEGGRQATRFVGGFVLACAVLFALSHATGRGGSAWVEWAEGIRVHSSEHVLGTRRFGVKRLGLHRPTAEDWLAPARGPSGQRIATASRRALALQLLGAPVLLVALRRRRLPDAMVLMLFGAFLAVVVSRYYASTWLLMGTLAAAPRGSPGPPSVAHLVAGSCMLIIPWALALPFPTAEGQYFVANYLAFAVWIAVCLAVSAAGPQADEPVP